MCNFTSLWLTTVVEWESNLVAMANGKPSASAVAVGLAGASTIASH